MPAGGSEDDDFAPGALVALLLSKPRRARSCSPSNESNDDGAASSSPVRTRSRSRSRVGKRLYGRPSSSPQPKRMPKKRMLDAPSISDLEDAYDSDLWSSEEEVEYQQPLLPAKPKARAAPKKGVITIWRGAGGGRITVPRPPPAKPRQLGQEERWAMVVLARHSARLADAGPGLESAVRRAAAKATGHSDVASRWRFLLNDPPSFAEYKKERARFAEIYNRHGVNPQSDTKALVEAGKAMSAFGNASGGAAAAKPSAAQGAGSNRSLLRPKTAQKGKMGLSPSGALPGGGLILPVPDIRFAHNDQSETFRPGSRGERRSILQLAVELIAALTPPTYVPTFTVCSHERRWYCRSGNRRLAAFHLASKFSPNRLGRLRVQVTEADEVFIKGKDGRRPKLTTHMNGGQCEGRWMFIRETGEVVGSDLQLVKATRYGADLLNMIPLPESAYAAAVGGLARGGA